MLIIEKMITGDEQRIHDLVKKVYDEFVAGDCTEEGNNTFYDFIKPESISMRLQSGNIIFICKEGDCIIGMIELKDLNHISLLFVDKDFQGLGIARKLFNETVGIARSGGNNDFIDVNSSLFAIPIYTKLGFKTTSEVQIVNGIKFVRMKCELK